MASILPFMALVLDPSAIARYGFLQEATQVFGRSLRGNQLIMLMAHRIRTVEAYDRIVLLEDGRVIGDGPYAALLEASEAFRDLVRGSAHSAARVS